MTNERSDRGDGRDAKGRWRKGYCPNPKGRPKKPPRKNLDLSDLEVFGNILIDVVSSGEKVTMLRRAVLEGEDQLMARAIEGPHPAVGFHPDA